MASGSAELTGENKKIELTVNVFDDIIQEGQERFTIRIDNVNHNIDELEVLGEGVLTAIINDNDLPEDVEISFSVSDLAVTEGDSLEITIDAIGDIPVGSELQLEVEAIGAIAASGIDFESLSESLTFSASNTSQTISLNTIADNITEENETFILTFSASTDDETIIFDGLQAREGVIEEEGAVEPVPASYTVEIVDQTVDEDAGTIQVAVKGTGTLGIPFSMDYTLVNFTTQDADYVDRGTGQIILSGNDGSTSTIVIDIVDDAELEGEEMFHVELSNPSEEGVDIIDSSADIVITDNDEDPLPMKLSSVYRK